MSFVVADSDYQLGSAAQTPGLNNSGTTVEYEVPTSQHITPLAEAYIARDRAYANQHVSSTEKVIVKFEGVIFKTATALRLHRVEIISD